jgi:hypothetical protein
VPAYVWLISRSWPAWLSSSRGSCVGDSRTQQHPGVVPHHPGQGQQVLMHGLSSLSMWALYSMPQRWPPLQVGPEAVLSVLTGDELLESEKQCFSLQ